jgi:hypothetical protein
MNSAAVALASISVVMSRKLARNCSPPFAQAFSKIAVRSSGETSKTERSSIVKGWPLVVARMVRLMSA